MADRQLEDRFNKLAEIWRRQTAYLSSITAKSKHPAYQEIIAMGSAVLPLIFRELRQKPDHWFWALTQITGENPISPEHAGNICAMRDDWLQWAENNGYA